MAVITISRQFGSGGSEIAALVSQRLNYTYVDKQIIAEAAKKSGLPVGNGKIEFTEYHSELRSFIDRLLFPGPHIVAQVSVRGDDESSVFVEELDKSEALTLVRDAIHAVYQQGDAVIVGRGGQAVLQEMPEVLHIRMVAPLSYRLLQVQQAHGLDMEEARDLIAQRDRRSAAYLKEVFGIDWDNPLLYHLVVNTARWQPEVAADLIADAVRELAG
ncbi:MAG: cytidylate kinase-like family protein [Anaerolineae bacterium]|nr:cytidylate kinase-like family protein [Anaerolineae bacterium]